MNERIQMYFIIRKYTLGTLFAALGLIAVGSVVLLIGTLINDQHAQQDAFSFFYVAIGVAFVSILLTGLTVQFGLCKCGHTCIRHKDDDLCEKCECNSFQYKFNLQGKQVDG